MNRILLVLALLASLSSAGCTRTFWRRQADMDAYGLVHQKANHPHWAIPNYTITLDPRSRMFDPYCADCPPLPPDDPTAHQFMHCVDNMRNYPFWHNNGDVPNVENPAWAAYYEFTEDGILQVSADDAVRLGLLNSRQYQQEKEDLYLSALDVSFERFRFQTQGFAGYQTFFTSDGRLRAGSGGESQSVLQAGTFSLGARPNGWSLQKAFSTGSTLVVGFANQLVWQFSGPDDYTPTTLLDFSLVQPLLKNAGRNRVLERLTRSERVLLYNVRAMEQYQQGFYLNIMTGRDAGAAPQRQGGVFGAGLEGFSGVGGNGFGRLQTNQTNISNSGAGGAGAGGAGGYLGLLQNQQVIRNQEDNVERLRRSLDRLTAIFDEQPEAQTGAYLQQQLQVVQARQALFNAESTLLNLNNQYQQTLDGFKITLGLPPQLCIKVSDRLLDGFQLIDPFPMQMQREVDQIVQRYGAAPLRIEKNVTVELDPNNMTANINKLAWNDEVAADIGLLKARAEELRQVRERLLAQYVPELEKDLAEFAAAVPRRKAELIKLQERVRAQQNDPCPLMPVGDINAEIFRAARLDQSLAGSQMEMTRLATKVSDSYAAHLDQQIKKLDEILAEGKNWTPERRYQELYDSVLAPKAEAVGGGFRDILNEMPEDILAMQLLQARARSESIELAAVDIRAEAALEIARKYRRDWMNARAGLVDSWRLIQFNADQLQSTLNVIFSGDIANHGQGAFSLNSDTGRLRAGVQFDAPITRLSERNVYRQSLIEYQQARRSYYAFEDQIAGTLRADLRTIYTNAINFELQRQAVLIAAEQSALNFYLQTDQEQAGAASATANRPTAARDAVSALSDLLSAQNNFLSIWVNYEALRRALDFDLGTMQLDSDGLWIDPGTIGEDYGQYDPWVWKSLPECDPGLPQPNEIPPADIVPHPHRTHTEELPLPNTIRPYADTPPIEIPLLPSPASQPPTTPQRAGER